MSSKPSRYILAFAAMLLAFAAPAAAQSNEDRGNKGRTEDVRPAPANPQRPSLRRRPAPSENPAPAPRERPRENNGDPRRRTSGAADLPEFGDLRLTFDFA